MLAHTENQGGLRAHGPLRNSTLRQVTSTDENPGDGVTLDASPGRRPLPTNPQRGESKHFPKVARLGILDASAVTTCALLDPATFPEDIPKPRLITIGPAPDTDAAVEGQPQNGSTIRRTHRTSICGLANGINSHLFTTEFLDSNQSAKPPDAQIYINASDAVRCGLKPNSQVLVSTVDGEDYQASHVEIAFRDEYLSRSDMWRLVVSELAGKVVRKGQRLLFIGTIKVHVKNIYVRGQRVQSAFFSASTKPVFRSESARYVLFIQMSKEMWDFDTDASGQIMFDKVVNGFLPDLFKRWQQIPASHLVTIVMFTRLEFEQGPLRGPLNLSTLAAEQPGISSLPSQDFYRVVVSDMPSGDWSDILVQLKKEFRTFLRDVSIRQPHTPDYGEPEVDLPGALGDSLSPVITGHPVPALRGNILEAVNLASSQFSSDYVDRDLVRTGISVIVITPGTGLFEVDYDLLATTTDNLIENSVGIDLVCLSRLPLHSVPLFKYRPPQRQHTQNPNPSTHKLPEFPAGLPKDQPTIHNQRSALRDVSVCDSLGSSLGAGHGASDMTWRYGIPHWVDVSFWTTLPVETSGLPVDVGKGRRTSQPGRQRSRKVFIPRVRMYELQMMGVTENSMNHIRLPYLSKSITTTACKPSVPISLPDPTPPDRQPPNRGHLMSRPSGDTKLLSQSGSVLSTSSVSVMRSKPQYRWMDEYDQIIFQHPRKRQRAIKGSQQSERMLSSSVHKRLPDRISPVSGSFLTASNNQMRDFGDHGKPTRLKEINSSKAINPTSRPAHMASTSSTPQSGSQKISRQISLGFRGINVNLSKATASTEVSTTHAKPASATTQRQHAQGRSQSILNSTPMPLLPPKIRHEVDSNNDSLNVDKSFQVSGPKDPISARPIPIRNPTEIRIPPVKEDSLPGLDHSSNPSIRHEQRSIADDRLRPLASQETDLSEHQLLPQKSPTSTIAPWLTVVNPSNPKRIESNSASRLGRWQHIFPKKLRASKFKWKSLCSPAAVPLTTEEFPSADELGTDYDSSTHKVFLPADDELLEQPRSQEWLLRELVAFRFSQGFQVVVGSRLADALYLPNFERFSIFDDSELTKSDTTIIMSKGSAIHKVSAAERDCVEVECLSRRTAAAHSKTESMNLDVYKPMVRTMLAEDYFVQNIAIHSGHHKIDWSLVDTRIAGHPKQELDDCNGDLRTWRARFVLVPVSSASSTRRPLQPLNEDNEEELRLEGIRKLTQIWQRFRHVPPSERRFQAPSRKRRDTNPLDIMYQTRNPSAIVAAEKDNLGEGVSTGKPVQLLPESELLQRANLNLQVLAQTIQGDKGVRMMDRRWHWRLHYDCFIGSELTSWLLQNFRDVDTGEEAVELGNELMKNGLFQHVHQRHNFRDGNYFYQIASEYRSARPESRNTWFGSKKADKVPSTPMSEGLGQESPKAPASRSSLASDEPEKSSSAPAVNRQRLGVALSKSLLYDVDHRKRSYRPELITLHYDRLHNPDNCYHIRIDWMNVTSKLIEDAIVSWATTIDRFGLKLIEVPLAEASTITSMHPFRAPALVKLAKAPPPEQPQTYFDATSFMPQAKTEKHFYQKALMKRFGFVLDFEAASDFPADVDVTYSWGKPDYQYPQYIHRSGTLLAQITDEGEFLLLANRLYNNRNAPPQDPARSADSDDQSSAGAPNLYGATRTTRHRGSPHISPYSSPLFRATADLSPAPRAPRPPSLFETPAEIKKQFENFCTDVAALEVFYNDVLSKASTPAVGTPSTNTLMMESSIPTLGLPPSLMDRGRSPAPDARRPKVRIVSEESPQPAAKHISIGNVAEQNQPLPARDFAYQLGRRFPFPLGRGPAHREHVIHQYHGRHARNEHGERNVVFSPRSGASSPDRWHSFPGSKQISRPNATAAHLLLTKRAPLANFQNYVCKGRRYLDNMKSAVAKTPKFSYDSLKSNGWVVEDYDPWEPLAPTIGRLMEQLGIPLAEKENRILSCELMNAFVNYRGESKKPLGGDYIQTYNPAGGAIIAMSNFSPTYRAQVASAFDEDMAPLSGDNLRAAIPDMHTWADVTWSIWAHEAGGRAQDLRYIIQYDIVTLVTQSLMETIAKIEHGDKPTKSLKLPWPGRTFDMKEENGLALLGSPHGVGISWLYGNGRAVLNARDVEGVKVTIFTGQLYEDDRTKEDMYFMLWDLERFNVSSTNPPSRRLVIVAFPVSRFLGDKSYKDLSAVDFSSLQSPSDTVAIAVDTMLFLWLLCLSELCFARPEPQRVGIHNFWPTVDLGYSRYRPIDLNHTGQYYNFSNIRYAAPPIGGLRWRPPQNPLKDRGRVKDGSQGFICPQAAPLWFDTGNTALGDLGAVIPPAASSQAENEDCLFLDVIAPIKSFPVRHSKKPLVPVLFNIHGGGFWIGEKRALYPPNGLLQAGNNDFIYVSINYRLAAFGFLSHLTPSPSNTTTPNAGLLDQRFALKWVRKYIHLFGGDPRQVTILGESAGGASVLYQTAAYGGAKETNLFIRGISQSPAPLLADPIYPTLGANLFLKEAGVTSVDAARKLPTEVLQQANLKAQGTIPFNVNYFGPIVDGEFIVDLLPRAYSAGKFNKNLGVITSDNQNESRFLGNQSIETNADFDNWVRVNFPSATESVRQEIIHQIYPPVYDGSQPYTNPQQRSDLAVDEYLIKCNTVSVAEAYRNQTYNYIFGVPPAIHAQDLAYTYSPNAGTPGFFPTVAANLQTYLVNFVLRGNPNGNGLPGWPVYGPIASAINFTEYGILETQSESANSRCAFWNRADYYPKPREGTSGGTEELRIDTGRCKVYFDPSSTSTGLAPSFAPATPLWDLLLKEAKAWVQCYTPATPQRQYSLCHAWSSSSASTGAMAAVSDSEIAYQRSHASEFNAGGLSAFCIAGEILVVIAVLLRVYSRKIAHIALQADDFTLIVAMVLSVAAVILFDVRVYHWGMGRHWYSLSTTTQIDYAFNLCYTTGYPLSRISLVLLYHRIFVQRWFRNICWFFVAVFSGYMISTVVVDSLLRIPVRAYWDRTITPERSVDLVKLYIANAAFNITTDSILLLLPITIVWRLSMTWTQKLGLTAIFAMGALTLVASIARLVFFYQVRTEDISYTLVPIVWWTSAELFLGILCPCLVTFRPLFRSAHGIISSSRFFSASRRGYARSRETNGTVSYDTKPPQQHSNSLHKSSLAKISSPKTFVGGGDRGGGGGGWVE
ncbi:MAG: hypothetical protein Q9216_003936, partial [Gyalolechia sp. 2 TL-2023]